MTEDVESRARAYGTSRLLRERLDLTQAELAYMLGVHAMTVSKWERGTGHPSAYNMQQLGLLALGASRLTESDLLTFRGLLALGSGVGALAFVVMRGMTQVGEDAGLVGET
jgi:transcriptional regulator with XRE-family HTH domain